MEQLDEAGRVKSEYVLKERDYEAKKSYCRLGVDEERRIEGEGSRVMGVSRKYKKELELKRVLKQKRKKRIDIALRNEIKEEEREYLREIMSKEGRAEN